MPKIAMVLVCVWWVLATSSRANAAEVLWHFDLPASVELQTVVEGRDGGAIIIANDRTKGFPEGLVIGLSDSGKVQWEKRYPMSFATVTRPVAVMAGDDGIILAGKPHGGGEGTVAMRIDLDGAIVWTNRISNDELVEWIVVAKDRFVAFTSPAFNPSEYTVSVRNAADFAMIARNFTTHKLSAPLPTADAEVWMASAPDGTWYEVGKTGLRPSTRSGPDEVGLAARRPAGQRAPDGRTFTAFPKGDKLEVTLRDPSSELKVELPNNGEVVLAQGVVARRGGGWFIGSLRYPVGPDGRGDFGRPLPGRVARLR